MLQKLVMWKKELDLEEDLTNVVRLNTISTIQIAMSMTILEGKRKNFERQTKQASKTFGRGRGKRENVQ